MRKMIFLHLSWFCTEGVRLLKGFSGEKVGVVVTSGEIIYGRTGGSMPLLNFSVFFSSTIKEIVSF